MATPPAGEHIARPSLKPGAPPVPSDEGLPGLQRLFEAGWVWDQYRNRFGEPEEQPERLRAKQLIYRPGRRAVVGYVAERRWDDWVAEEPFAIEMRAGKPDRVFRFPEDPYLPGLPVMASPAEAQDVLSRCVPLRPQRLYVETVRYRPTNRAVLRHEAGWRRASAGKVTLYCRVMQPARVERLLAASELAGRSGFVLPRIAGAWPEGGAVWVAGSPGETVRTLIRKGKGPAPELILDALAKLWAVPAPHDPLHALDLAGAFRFTERVLSQVLEEERARDTLRQAAAALRPFVESWQPAAIAHNDFYDDQILLGPDGRLILVDFEETGPGDPLLDVGNLLAHLRWMARFGRHRDACAGYRTRMREAALERFGWEDHDLAQREALALFRLSSNPVRQLQRNWPETTRHGLELALEVLGTSA